MRYIDNQVTIIGAGPVGLLLAILLGQKGHEVVWLTVGKASITGLVR